MLRGDGLQEEINRIADRDEELSRLDWSILLDGTAWVLDAGVDYSDERRLRAAVRYAAGKRGVAVTVRQVEGGLLVRAVV